MPVLDTSFLLAILDSTDTHHAKAKATAASHTELVIPVLVVAELLQVVRHRVGKQAGARAGREAARKTFRALDESAGFVVEQAFDASLASALFRGHASLSYVDAVAISVALRGNEPLFSFDKGQLAALAKQRLA